MSNWTRFSPSISEGDFVTWRERGGQRRMVRGKIVDFADPDLYGSMAEIQADDGVHFVMTDNLELDN